MAISIGHHSYIELTTASEGPRRRPLRVVSFTSRTDTGAINHPMFRTDDHTIAIIDLREGKVRASEFTDPLVTGIISQTDTGPGGHQMLAIMGDTGPQ
jgi:hypothetical protein